MREVSRRSFHFIAKNADEAVPFSAGEPRVREEQRLTHREVLAEATGVMTVVAMQDMIDSLTKWRWGSRCGRVSAEVQA